MSILTNYIENENRWSKLFNTPKIARPTNKEECRVLFNRLEQQLSPENLCCDGEISRAKVNRKYKELMKVWKALENIQHKL